MSENNKYDIEDLISNSVNQKPLEFADAFNNLILDKLHNAIENKKMEVASQLYNYQRNSGNETEQEDFDDEIDSEEEVEA